MNIPVKACDEHLLRSSNTCIGASTLMKLLSNYCRKYDIKTSITVGIVGTFDTKINLYKVDNRSISN